MRKKRTDDDDDDEQSHTAKQIRIVIRIVSYVKCNGIIVCLFAGIFGMPCKFILSTSTFAFRSYFFRFVAASLAESF